MSKPIIQVENLSKRYHIGAREEGYSTFRESLTGAIKAPFQRFRHSGSTPDDTIWALKDVSFEVQPGEVVGIIGRNGAGKSTLLKVLSRITEPTTGTIKLYGRVASLLEVGTGFHPELTGRENIFLNGAILGMARSDIERQFDAIVDFAEVETFIDTPVKRYSSGMYLRLAFAVAAHLDPEILVVDEVLAVGDMSFQKKCLGKMGEVARQGRTVLFVSHNMEAVRTLTERGVVLENGTVTFSGLSSAAISTYLKSITKASDNQQLPIEAYRRPRSSSQPVTIESITINGNNSACVDMLDDIVITCSIRADYNLPQALIDLVLRNETGQIVTHLCSNDQGQQLSLREGVNIVECCIPSNPLTPGRYTIDIGVNQSTATMAWDVIHNYPALSVVIDAQVEELGWVERVWGAIHLPNATWQTIHLPEKRLMAT